MGDRKRAWHLGDQAIYDYIDDVLTSVGVADVERHLRDCPECARRVRRAELLFARLQTMDPPRLGHDLAPGVVFRLKAARASGLRWRWVLAAQAAAATVAIGVLGLNLDRWLNALNAPSFLALRQAGLRLAAEVSALVAPFLGFIPSFPARLASLHITLPHLAGPVWGWAGLGVAAIVLGVVGNALLLRPAEGLLAPMTAAANVRPILPGRLGNGSSGRRP